MLTDTRAEPATISMTPQPSATVLLLRETQGTLEVLMTRRPTQFQFMGGLWVFPGGCVDDADRALAAELALGPYRAAACRETREEVGVTLEPESLVYFGHWITPVAASRRFETRFFIASFPTGQTLTVAASEASEHGWFAPGQVVDAQTSGRMPLAPPTLLSLIDLAASFEQAGGSVDRLLAQEAEREVPPITPRLLTEGDSVYALMPWADPQAQQGPTYPEWLRRLPSRIVLARQG